MRLTASSKEIIGQGVNDRGTAADPVDWRPSPSPVGGRSLAFGKGIRTVCLERIWTRPLIERVLLPHRHDFHTASASPSWGRFSGWGG
jgi:hypothetical protein